MISTTIIIAFILIITCIVQCDSIPSYNVAELIIWTAMRDSEFDIPSNIQLESTRYNDIIKLCGGATVEMQKNENKIKLEWKKLLPKPHAIHGVPCERSSHGLSLVRNGSRLILHGGERIARTPLDSTQATWAADKSANDSGWVWRLIKEEGDSDDNVPPERIAHAQAVYNDSMVFIFGGRAGISMEEKAMNDLWVLDCSGEPGTEKWSQIEPDLENGDDPPEERSFHQMLCIGSDLYVFGGCSAHHGRLADIHKFNIPSKTWKNLGSSEHLRGRGGATFMTFSSGTRLGVVAGFAGEETNDGHMFNLLSNKWEGTNLNSQLEGLRPRSVCIGASFPSIGKSVIFGGEVDPSEKGHEGAGGFENDVVLLDEATSKYLKSEAGDGEWPERRGWSHGASIDDGEGKGQLFVFGGLAGDDANPRRLDDLWRLDITSDGN